MNTNLAFLAWDARRARRGGPAAVAARQEARLAALVALARQHSRYYAERYAHLPAGVASLPELPPVTKRDLMAHFDDWVTNPAVRWSDVSAFVAEPGRSAEPYLGRYLVWQTSGTSGVPVVLLQDRAARAVSGALDLTRGLPTWMSWRDVATFVRRGRRVAAVLARDGHWATWVALQDMIRRQPWRRGSTACAARRSFRSRPTESAFGSNPSGRRRTASSGRVFSRICRPFSLHKGVRW